MHFAMKNGKISFSLRKFLAISPAIQKIASDCGCDAVVHRAQNPENPKSLKTSLPRGDWDPPIPDPEKVKKGSKSQDNSLFSDFCLTFRTFFGLFRGPGSGGPKLLSGDLFETFRVFGVLGSVDGGGDLNISVHLSLL